MEGPRCGALFRSCYLWEPAVRATMYRTGTAVAGKARSYISEGAKGNPAPATFRLRVLRPDACGVVCGHALKVALKVSERPGGGHSG